MIPIQSLYNTSSYSLLRTSKLKGAETLNDEDALCNMAL